MNSKNYKAYQQNMKNAKSEDEKQVYYGLNNLKYTVFTGIENRKSNLSLTPELEDFITQLLSAMFESQTIFFTSKYVDYVLNLFKDIHIIKKENGKEYKTEVFESKEYLEDVEMKMRIKSFPNKAYGILYRLENFEAGGIKFNSSASCKHVIFKFEDE